jgi:hypothetical protein
MLRGILATVVVFLVLTIFRAHLSGPGGLYAIQIPAVNALVAGVRPRLVEGLRCLVDCAAQRE